MMEVVVLWIGFACCLTGPEPQPRLSVGVGEDVEQNDGGAFDADADGDVDLADVATVFNLWSDVP